MREGLRKDKDRDIVDGLAASHEDSRENSTVHWETKIQTGMLNNNNEETVLLPDSFLLLVYSTTERNSP